MELLREIWFHVSGILGTCGMIIMLYSIVKKGFFGFYKSNLMYKMFLFYGVVFIASDLIKPLESYLNFIFSMALNFLVFIVGYIGLLRNKKNVHPLDHA